MNALFRSFAIAILLILFSPSPAKACTTFVLRNNDGTIVFGRNFDFPAGLGHVHINKRNLQKTSFISPPEKPMTWVSKYGSITFNQNGKELPYGGMNEAGLVIEQMWHQEAKYPEMDERYGLTELQWIQYQLDNSATVEDVINTDKHLRISATSVATLHFLVSDTSGNVAVIEYINGKMHVHSGKELPYTVLANCTYDVSLDYKKHKEAGSEIAFAGWTENSSGRFTTAAVMTEEFAVKEAEPVSYAFEILDKVSQGPATQWSIIYDLAERRIHYKTHKNPEIRTLNFHDFDYDCESEMIFIDIDQKANQPGDFKPYSHEANFNIINNICNSVEFLNQMPMEYRKAAAAYPENIHCITQ